MMCAFMTPVLKSDWEVYDTKTGKNGTCVRQTGSDVASSHRAQQLQRLRQIQHTQRQLLRGRSHSYHGDLSPPGGLQSLSSRTSLPISPLAMERGRSKAKASSRSSSSVSLNNFHNKVIDKLKNVLHIKDKEDKEQKEEDKTSRNTEHETTVRIKSKNSSRASFDIPVIAEEVLEESATEEDGQKAEWRSGGAVPVALPQ